MRAKKILITAAACAAMWTACDDKPQTVVYKTEAEKTAGVYDVPFVYLSADVVRVATDMWYGDTLWVDEGQDTWPAEWPAYATLRLTAHGDSVAVNLTDEVGGKVWPVADGGAILDKGVAKIQALRYTGVTYRGCVDRRCPADLGVSGDTAALTVYIGDYAANEYEQHGDTIINYYCKSARAVYVGHRVSN